jgi:general secretion pathway protein J
MARTRTRGFTLVEVLVALFVLTIISVAAFRGLSAVMNARDAVTQETRKWQGLMFLFSRMELDIALAIPRPVRNPAGQTEPEWIGHEVPLTPDDGQLILTRAGAQDVEGAQAGPQRIGYRLDQGTLYLLRWTALDQPPDAEPVRYALLQNVSAFHLRYLDADGAWSEQWPLPGRTGGIPAAVEVSITLEGEQPITRLFLTR